MKKKRVLFFWGAAALAGALSFGLLFAGCDQGDDTGGTTTTPSDDATLASAKVKGVEVDLTADTTSAGTFADPVEAPVTVSDTAAADTAGGEGFETAFTPTAGDKAAVKAVFAATAPATAEDFETANAYDGTASIVAGGKFIVRVTAEDNTAVKWYVITVTVATATDQSTSVTVTADDDTLVVTKTGGTYAGVPNVFVKDDGTEVVITKEGTVTGFTQVDAAKVAVDGDVITVTLPKADAGGGSGKLKAGTVSVKLDADAQASPVTSITATSYDSTKANYTVTYDGNGNTGGTVPAPSTHNDGATVTVAGNTGNLVKTGHSFTGWDTNADGSGTSYAAGATFTISANTTLYAQWNNLAEDLVTALGGSGKASAVGSTVTLTDDVTLSSALPIPAGITLVVPNGKTLDDSGNNLTVTGDLQVAGTATISGSGSVAVGNGTNDAVVVGNGSSIANASLDGSTGSIVATGEITVGAGSKTKGSGSFTVNDATSLASVLAQSGADDTGIASITLATAAALTAAAELDTGATLTLSADLTFGTTGATAFTVSGTLAGSGVIKTSDDGTISAGTLTGLTTESAGVAGTDFADTLTKLTADIDKLTDTGSKLATATWGANSDGIGSVALNSTSATEIKDGGDGSTGSAITLDTGTTLAGTLTGGTTTGTNSSDISSGTTITVGTDSGKVTIADTGYDSSNEKSIIVPFDSVTLKNGNLISGTLPAFHIGVKTGRS